MAKKNKSLLGLLAIGAAAAGTYYYLQKKNSKIPSNMEDDEDLDNFSENIEEDEKEEPKRSYTSLNFSDVEKKVTDAAAKFADTAEKAVSEVGVKLQTAAGKIEEFFDDRKSTVEDTVEDDAADDIADEFVDEIDSTEE